jgi:hypothetical protein
MDNEDDDDKENCFGPVVDHTPTVQPSAICSSATGSMAVNAPPRGRLQMTQTKIWMSGLGQLKSTRMNSWTMAYTTSGILQCGLYKSGRTDLLDEVWL